MRFNHLKKVLEGLCAGINEDANNDGWDEYNTLVWCGLLIAEQCCVVADGTNRGEDDDAVRRLRGLYSKSLSTDLKELVAKNAERFRSDVDHIELEKRCPDCGEYGHIKGHMGCQFPT